MESVAVRVFNVLLAKHAHVEETLTSLTKRAVKKGLTPVAWSWGKAVTKTWKDTGPGGVEVDRSETYVPLTLTGEPPHYAGWAFLAALEHLDGENLVRGVPGKDVPVEYRTRGPQCDHCKADRKRHDTYVLGHEDGRVVQVGSTCLKDFLGSDDAGRLADAATYWAEVGGAGEDGESGDGEGFSNALPLGAFLGFVAFLVRTDGWVSRTVAREREGAHATSDVAFGALTTKDHDERDKNRRLVTDEDRETALKAETWAEGLTDDQLLAERGDYLHNVRAVVRTGLVDFRKAGIAASVITAYQRAVGAERKRAERAARPPSVHVGTVGKRETWSVTLDFVAGWESAYGYTTLLKFVTDSGAVLVWKTGDCGITRCDVGKRYSVKGTTKAHDLYKGTAQTTLTRCKVTEVEASPSSNGEAA